MEVSGFTQQCVISITDRLVIRPGEGTIRGRRIVGSGQQFSPQRCMNGIQQSSPGKRFFEERDAALQHFAFRDQFTGVP